MSSFEESLPVGESDPQHKLMLELDAIVFQEEARLDHETAVEMIYQQDRDVAFEAFTHAKIIGSYTVGFYIFSKLGPAKSLFTGLTISGAIVGTIPAVAGLGLWAKAATDKWKRLYETYTN